MTSEKSNETSETLETMMKGCMDSMGNCMKDMQKMMPQIAELRAKFPSGRSCCQPESE
ncbi:MAG: hypothetical protein ACXAC6_10975 [Candidatus Hodarchaeales archaeon]